MGEINSTNVATAQRLESILHKQVHSYLLEIVPYLEYRKQLIEAIKKNQYNYQKGILENILNPQPSTGEYIEDALKAVDDKLKEILLMGH